MKTFEEAVDETLTPLTEAVAALGHCQTVQEQKHRVTELAVRVTAAEAFAARTTQVETRGAKQYRASVESARHILEHHRTKLETVPSAGPEIRVVSSDTPSKPQPPANALVLTREQARDVPTYRRAKTQAAAEGKTLWIEPM